MAAGRGDPGSNGLKSYNEAKLGELFLLDQLLSETLVLLASHLWQMYLQRCG